MTTVIDVLHERTSDDRPAIIFEGRTWSYTDLVVEARRRAALFDEFHDPAVVPHIGILLDNQPEYLFWLAAAALRGAAAVGINSTYRGAALAQLIEHTDCEFVITSSQFRPLIDEMDVPLDVGRIIDIEAPEYGRLLASTTPSESEAEVDESTLFLLIFTSGSTGAPKAVRCTQGRYARTGAHVAGVANLGPGDVVYTSLPFFHSSSLFTGWASALHAGVPLATRRKFSASKTLADIRDVGATMLTYTGKVLNYILAVPERPDDGDNPLRLAIGNEASPTDLVEFARRFACDVRDSYGSTEGIIIIRRDPSMPEGALGRADESVKVLDPETGAECPPIERDADGHILNLEAATGEIVETAPTGGFEGYYNNDEATQERFRDSWYWSGDLAYRDEGGWFYFAGRSNEWLRVDGENFAAAPVERIVARHPAVRACAVYAVPDDPVGDRVMVAVELAGDAQLDPDEFDTFLRAQPDLGPKWLPSFLLVTTELPKLASMKIDKRTLRRQAWLCGEVLWRPGRNEGLRELSDEDRKLLEHLLP